jgi:integrase
MPMIGPDAPVARRRLAREHFAFLRGLAQGGDARELWPRYMALEGRFDPRLAARTIAWLKDELAATARRDRRPRVARLVAMDLSHAPADPAVPSLEAFAQRFEPGFFSERELLALFAEAFPPTRRASRRARLIAQQLEALAWLESVAASDPALEDPVSSWLPETTAARLSAAGIRTLGELVDRVALKGPRWSRGVVATGPVKAARIVAWLAPHAARLGRPVGVGRGAIVRGPEDGARGGLAELAGRGSAGIARGGSAGTANGGSAGTVPGGRSGASTPRTAIVPLEQFLVPAALDGRDGRARAPRALNRLGVERDRDALDAWLRGKRSAHTVRAYTKEAERLLLWAILVRGQALSSLGPADCEAYLRFCADPQPRAHWCGPRGSARGSLAWRPFNGPLDAASVRHARAILSALFGWLEGQGYLAGNPWDALAHRGPQAAPSALPARALSAAQWARVDEVAQALPDTGANRRLRVVLALLRATGLRREELVGCRVGDLERRVRADGGDGWVLVVRFAQDRAQVPAVRQNARQATARWREVDLPPELVVVLRNYLACRGLPDDPTDPRVRDAFLIGRVHDATERIRGRARPFDPAAGVSAGTLYAQLKAFLATCAQQLDRTAPADAQALRRASLQWLRHAAGAAL